MQGSFSESALEQFAQLAAQTQPENFAEGDAYDFTRCVRANGSAYGTRGKCRKGTESASKPEDNNKGEFGSFGKLNQDQRDRRVKQQYDLVRDLKKEGNPNWRSERDRLDRMLDKDKEGATGAPKSADLDRIKANRAGSAAKKANSVELKAAWKNTQGAVKSAATEAKRVVSETKGDKTPEARAKRLAAGAALDKAKNAAFKASEKFFAATKRESRAAMTPEQRKLEREADKLTKGG